MRNTKGLKLFSLLVCLVVIVQLLPFYSTPITTHADNNSESKIIVSMGDSFSSGEGIPEFYGQNKSDSEKVKDQDWLAHRSEKSWPGRLTLPGVKGQMSENRDTNWYFVATSGAKTYHIKNRFKKDYEYGDEEGYNYVDAQINVFNKLGDKKADYVTLTLGGNDAEFTQVVGDAVVDSTVGILNPSALANRLNTVWQNFYKSGGIRDSLHQSYKDISDAAGKQAKIIVAGYPKLLEQSGDGVLFTNYAADLVNDSVTRFNKEIEAIVNTCKTEGIKICFVDVEEKFNTHEAYSKDAYLNKVKIFKQSEDLVQSGFKSAYSMHPNEKGAKVYAECVQAKIDSIEKDGGKSEWPDMMGSDERDVVLVLDVSGSMDGTPIEETKAAAKKFVDTVIKENTAVGIVTYDNYAMMVSDFCMNQDYLENVIDNINAGGNTNIDAGLTMAHEMLKESNAKKKLIVLMSDGAPNLGRTGETLIAFADDIKEDDIYIYTLGFFSNLSYKVNEQALLEGIASEGCHFEVDDAEQLVFFFGDIADQIRGTKYMYIRIACPVDVTVEHNGQKLSSKNAESNQRTDFGTLTFEENTEDVEDPEDTTDNRIKILRLKDGEKYDIRIDGNGKGRMTYTIGFMDEDGKYSDMREFSDIRITKKTEIDTVAVNSPTTTLKVDEDGDGEYDYIYQAEENGDGELVDYTDEIWLVISPIILLLIIIILIIVIKCIKKRVKKTALPSVITTVASATTPVKAPSAGVEKHTIPTPPTIKEEEPVKSTPPVTEPVTKEQADISSPCEENTAESVTASKELSVEAAPIPESEPEKAEPIISSEATTPKVISTLPPSKESTENVKKAETNKYFHRPNMDL